MRDSHRSRYYICVGPVCETPSGEYNTVCLIADTSERDGSQQHWESIVSTVGYMYRRRRIWKDEPDEQNDDRFSYVRTPPPLQYTPRSITDCLMIARSCVLASGPRLRMEMEIKIGEREMMGRVLPCTVLKIHGKGHQVAKEVIKKNGRRIFPGARIHRRA